MRAVLQRILKADITIDGTERKSVGQGLLVLLGVMEGDGQTQAEFLAKKIPELRIFEDGEGRMNLSLEEIGGEMMVVSNFTLGADCKKGRRPSYTKSARPEDAEKLYDYFLDCIRRGGETSRLETGKFGADMQIKLINDGPVTIILDTDEIQPKGK